MQKKSATGYGGNDDHLLPGSGIGAYIGSLISTFSNGDGMPEVTEPHDASAVSAETLQHLENSLGMPPENYDMETVAGQFEKAGISRVCTEDFLNYCSRLYLFQRLLHAIGDSRAETVRHETGRDRYLLIISGGYPSEQNPNKQRFAHDRVLQYRKAGLEVDVFCLFPYAEAERYEYEGVNVYCGSAEALRDVLVGETYAKLLIHFVNAWVMHAIHQAGRLNMPMIVWCHGYEVTAWYRCWFNYSELEQVRDRPAMERQDAVKRQLLSHMFNCEQIHFVFVSEWLLKRCEKFVGKRPKKYSVIHNFVHHEFFAGEEKVPHDRFRVLSIKNHATRMYANDLTAKAILLLSDREWFPEVSFELYGKGILFDENYAELIQRNLPNVHIHETFLNHEEMRGAFRRNGIFLAPTRMDSHPVTTSEAMSAGMVVITSCAGPIREFMDESCGSIFEYDNYWMLAEDIEYLYFHPDEFVRKSGNAAKRIRTQCSYEVTMGRELELIRGR